MARIRLIEVQNFRTLYHFCWQPSEGMNCLLGPGDSGKSTVLDAIDLCLGARRSATFTDSDFYNLDVEEPILIRITIGSLEDSLKNFERYGDFLCGFNSKLGTIEDEPGSALETVLTVQLEVKNDLEPEWSLYSKRAEAKELSRQLAGGDRQRLSPTRLGVFIGGNLSWRRGSVLNALTSDELPSMSLALARAARDAREEFGETAVQQLSDTLKKVKETSNSLGIDVGGEVTALLEAQAVSIGSGTLALHNKSGVPLSKLGTGSGRLMVAGLQRKASETSPILLVDELEYGLEPHRIIRFLGSLGAKEEVPPLQVFCTTHSPIALRELSGNQLYVVREADDGHQARCVGVSDDTQGTIRSFPEAFLAKSVILCEGASEVGLLRGVDQWRCGKGKSSIFAQGVALVDCGGGSPDKFAERALAFQALGYRVAIFRDDDVKPKKNHEGTFLQLGGEVFAWSDGRSLEQALFSGLDDQAIKMLLDYAVACFGEDLIDSQIRSKASDRTILAEIRADLTFGGLSPARRALLAAAASTNKTEKCWFKSVTRMEKVGRDIVGPRFEEADEAFRSKLYSIFTWVAKGDE